MDAALRHPAPWGSDYHYGAGPDALLATRLICGDRAALDASARVYYISGFGATVASGGGTGAPPFRRTPRTKTAYFFW